jgi:hypothetical protein
MEPDVIQREHNENFINPTINIANKFIENCSFAEYKIDKLRSENRNEKLDEYEHTINTGFHIEGNQRDENKTVIWKYCLSARKLQRIRKKS